MKYLNIISYVNTPNEHSSLEAVAVIKLYLEKPFVTQKDFYMLHLAFFRIERWTRYAINKVITHLHGSSNWLIY